VKVCADSGPNNKKATVLQFKTVTFAKFRQNSSEIFSPQRRFFNTSSVFHQKRNPLQSITSHLAG